MLFSTWIETEYHREIHSSLGVTPLDAWLSKCNMIKRIDPTLDFDFVFLHMKSRKVYKDSIVSVEATAFEVPPVLIGKMVSVFYNPNPPVTRILVKCDGKNYGEAKPVDLYANTKVKRNNGYKGELEIDSEENNSAQAGGILL